MLSKIAIILILISSIYAKPRGVHATKEVIGQRYYLKHCSSCHGSAKRGGNLSSIYGWEELFKDNGKKLIFLHEGEKGTKEVLKYLKGKKFKYQQKEC